VALPVILVNSATGSDTQASGAGPTTALFGTTDASSDGTGLIVTVTAGTDLSGVATDGSHVLFFNDATAGKRNFGKITGTAGSGGATPTVTVADAFGLSTVNKSWAIGGKRASIASTTSKKLLDNNGAAGDAMPGWIVEMASGHSETIAATVDTRRAGDQTSGPITLRGVAGAATLPLLMFSNNGNGFVPRGAFQWFQDFEIRNSNATKTASIAFSMGAATTTAIWGIKISHSTDKFWKAATNGTSCTSFVGCEFGFCANIGFDVVNGGHLRLISNWIHDCASHGIAIGVGSNNIQIIGNLISTNGSTAGDGINISTLAGTGGNLLVSHNTIYANSSDGIEISATETTQQQGMAFINNILSGNIGYGINDSTGSNVGMLANFTIMFGNAFYNNTSGDTNPVALTCNLFSQSGVNPQFVNASTGNFMIGTNLKALGYPVGGTTLVGNSLTYSYVEPGAAQRQEPSASVGAIGAVIGQAVRRGSFY